jgi:hypothetical protein
MRIVKTSAALVLMFVFVVFIGACERKITTVETVQTAQNCFDCHSDQNTMLVSAEAQYLRSKHASGDNIDRNTISYGTPCVACHTSEGFVAKVSGETIPSVVPNPTAIHCFTCHAPHTNSDFRLRVTSPRDLATGDSFDLGDANICTTCHQALQNVNTYVTDPVTLSEHWGPHHGPQSDMLLRTNGYEYAGYTYEDLDFHRNLTEDGCLDCHFKTTRNYILGGHSFNMAWEVEGGEEEINTAGCTADCHGSMPDFNYHNVQDSVATLMEDLAGMLETAGLIDDTGHPLEVTTSADSAGAVWNFLIAEEDRSHGVHNSKYIITLLQSSIEYMQGTLASPGESGKVAVRKQ